MAYPAYDTYNQQVAFPVSRRQSMAYGDGYAYDPAHPVAGGVYANGTAVGMYALLQFSEFILINFSVTTAMGRNLSNGSGLRTV